MGAFFKFLLLGLSYLVPRSKRKWVFGSSMGFGGNAKYLFLNTKVRKVSYIWISPTRQESKELRELGYRAYYRNSLKGIFHSLTAKVWIFNTHIGDIKSTAVGSAYKVNLWHGVGLKKIRYQDEQYIPFLTGNLWTKISVLMKKFGRISMLIPPDLFLSTSETMTKHFCEALNIDQSRCIEGIYPRCSIFSWDTERLNDFISKNEAGLVDIVARIEKSSYTYIYMPTWRDTGLEFSEFSGINLSELDDALGKRDALMLIKVHPLTRFGEGDSPLKNIIFIPNKQDVYPLLPLTDCLITDYSSILYDYILMSDKDVVMYVPDMEYYLKNCRDLALPFEENICGAVISDFTGLLQHIASSESLCADTKYREDIERLRDKFWSKDALSQTGIISAIKSGIEFKKKGLFATFIARVNSLLKLLLLGLSYLTPRFKRKWVFGSNMGFHGNVKYLYLNTKSEDIDYIWIARTKQESESIKDLGHKVYYRNSFKGVLHCATAGVWVFDTNLGDIKSTAVGRALKVNLWHGVGLKKIRYQMSKHNKFFYGHLSERLLMLLNKSTLIDMLIPADLFLSTSDMMTGHFSDAFKIDKSRCIEGIYPRCSIFSWDRERLNDFIDKNEPELVDVVERINKSSYTYMYMPTWRDTGLNFFEFSGINLVELDDALGSRGALMLIKVHPLSRFVMPERPLENIIFISNKQDVYPLLPLTDCLVTDYSSILYDYILMPGKDVVLYVPDMEYYISSCRDLAFPFEENICGTIISDFSVFLQHITNRNSLCLDDNYRAQIELIRDRFWSKEAMSQEEIVDTIKSRVGIK